MKGAQEASWTQDEDPAWPEKGFWNRLPLTPGNLQKDPCALILKILS